jgi:AcrR family transcriptional regulator
MRNVDIRQPIQKRSIEKKEKIIEAGFNLICEKGYYNTNTAEIAKNAGVSTGIVYQYFKDKHDILIEGMKLYSSSIFYPILYIAIWKKRQILLLKIFLLY